MIDLFVIDPPWPKRKGGLRKVTPNQTRYLDYPTMSVPDIFALLDAEIFPQASPVHTVFMWTVDQFLFETESLMECHGYHRHARIIWDKGNGVAPCFTVRYTHEYLLWYYKPTLTKVAQDMRGKLGTVIRAGNREHSRKPDEAYQYVEALYPDATKLDVFSREPRAGWEQWGNQCDHFSLEAGA
jgi:N6-adenosine-specific RNA methylase IME4